MSKLRLLFVKEGPAAYISNLDLLRTVQRAFPRTELDIKHSQGFHPHPIISIVLPLPVGQSSDCELLDFEVTQDTDGRGIAEKLNTGMPSGLRVLDCYPASRPVRDLAYLRADVTFEYDAGVPAGAAEALTALFTRPALVIQKRTKRKDLADVDIAPMIQKVHFLSGAHAVTGTVVVQAQNPGLNPELILEGVVFTMYDARTNLSLQVVENVKDNLDQTIYKTIIPRNIRLAEAPSHGLPINLYDPRSTGAESYMLLADEVIHKGEE